LLPPSITAYDLDVPTIVENSSGSPLAPRAMTDWTLSPGDTIKRKDLHQQFGGSRQSGISPSAQSPHVFFFSDRSSGEQHGYLDEWKSDGCFHYVGEGQRGDQRMTGGNRAILEASQNGRALRGFEGTGGDVIYRGRFELAADNPWYTTDAPETGGGPIRIVIVFRLRPIDIDPIPSKVPPPATRMLVRFVPVEARNTERMVVEPTREPHEAERRESALVQQFMSLMAKDGHSAARLMITPVGEAKSIYTDLYFEDDGLLIEAKGSVDRDSIRMAIGQITDYRRFIKPGSRCAILLPSRPRPDLVELLGFAGIEIHYAHGQKFEVIYPPGGSIETSMEATVSAPLGLSRDGVA
jgi:hypothetical protein